jgi:hypothetical protein
LDFKSFNMSSLQRYLSPRAMNDLNEFLENLPQTAGQTALIAAGIAWTAAAALGLYTFVQVKALTELRAELRETEALVPRVPRIRDVPVTQNDLRDFAADLARIYPSLTVRPAGANIQITARATAQFGAFREAIGHAQNGGDGWRVTVDRMCVGRECDRDQLGVLLRISKVSVDRPS